MAGIGAYKHGETATLRDIYWEYAEDRLTFQAALIQRDGGFRTADEVVSDYGSDIGIDPLLDVSDRVVFVEVDSYTGIWVRFGVQLNPESMNRAVKRVTHNRRFAKFCHPGNSGHQDLESWMRELATQTRIPVQTSKDRISPGRITELASFSDEVLAWLQESPQRLKELNAETFETLLLQIFRLMGYHPQLVSSTRHKDGGVDLVVCSIQQLPFVFAVQAKHHNTDRSTDAASVRDFHGVLRAHPVFSFGLIVTNTRFTEDAKHFAQKCMPNLRLRDESDLCRWLGGDYSGEAEWREVLPEISLAPGVTIKLQPDNKPSKIADHSNALRDLFEFLFPLPDNFVGPFGR